MRMRATFWHVAILVMALSTARADEARVAVATNFASTLNILAQRFESRTDHRVTIISGSTGLLYAQIRNGAPFDLLLAADQERPRLLSAAGFGDPHSIFTYATGQLVLWSAEPDLMSEGMLGRLGEEKFRWFAIAEPNVAPYGIAARQALEQLGIWQSLQRRIVKGQNVGQAFSMIDTGNAELGLVALSQALSYVGESSFELVPKELHEPIRQDAIVLSAGRGNAAVEQFVEFLKSEDALVVIENSGYAKD